jgi:RNA polymerase sigma-70 factor (ECF subfamily)
MAEIASGAGRYLAAARAGDREALGHALEACRRYLLLVANRQLNGNLQAKGGASDLVQETFLEAQRDFGRFDGTSQDELLAWLRRILLNNAGNFACHYQMTDKRSVAREIALPTSDSVEVGMATPLPSPSRVAMAQEQVAALHRALGRLSDDYRRVLALRYLEGCSFDEVGRRMGRSPAAVRKLWARALACLRVEWEKPS